MVQRGPGDALARPRSAQSVTTIGAKKVGRRQVKITMKNRPLIDSLFRKARSCTVGTSNSNHLEERVARLEAEVASLKAQPAVKESYSTIEFAGEVDLSEFTVRVYCAA